MTATKTKNMLIAGGIFAFPMVLVKVTAVMLGSPGPQQAAAMLRPAVQTPVIQQQDHPLASEEEIVALQHIASLRHEPFGAAPLYYQKREPIKPVEQEKPDLDLVLQGIIARPHGSVALINGRIYRVGDAVGKSGSRVVHVDGEKRAVTIEDRRFEPPRKLRLEMTK